MWHVYDMKSTFIVSAFACLFTSCASLKQFPLTLVYETDVAGHSATVAYTSGKGVVVAAKKIRAGNGK